MATIDLYGLEKLPGARGLKNGRILRTPDICPCCELEVILRYGVVVAVASPTFICDLNYCVTLRSFLHG